MSTERGHSLFRGGAGTSDTSFIRDPRTSRENRGGFCETLCGGGNRLGCLPVSERGRRVSSLQGRNALLGRGAVRGSTGRALRVQVPGGWEGRQVGGLEPGSHFPRQVGRERRGRPHQETKILAVTPGGEGCGSPLFYFTLIFERTHDLLPRTSTPRRHFPEEPRDRTEVSSPLGTGLGRAADQLSHRTRQADILPGRQGDLLKDEATRSVPARAPRGPR